MWLQTFKNMPNRIKNAFGYSFDGLKNAFIKEESFRLETAGLAILILAMIFVPWPAWKKLVIFAVFFLIPFAELINSAIEDLGDLVSPEHNIYIKNAKDKGSAAVLLAIIINVLMLLAMIVI